MSELSLYLSKIFEEHPVKIVLSKARLKSEPYRRMLLEQKAGYWQLAKYTEKQVFHENIGENEIISACENLIAGHYQQVNAWSAEKEHIILLSKKGNPVYRCNPVTTAFSAASQEHNRKKNYILEENAPIAPLVDMGIFTAEGKVVRTMYDKFKQINRLLEMIDDEISATGKKHWNIIDFGCGKSYLTFIMYYYFTEIKGCTVDMIGLDLKADVIEKCNRTAEKYHYDQLRFELGDINGYRCPFDVDMVITLHACDTATDYALYNAVQWNAKLIFSVPCCQHELNGQINSEKLSLLTRYGIIQERFAALSTDAIRANLLEYCGYRTQLLEFIDLEHTPKNLLLRAVRRPLGAGSQKEKYLAEVERYMEEFHCEPTLYKMIMQEKE